MSYVLANISEGLPQYYTIDRKLSGGPGAAFFQGDIVKAIQFARKDDADRFADAYYPFMALAAKAFA